MEGGEGPENEEGGYEENWESAPVLELRLEPDVYIGIVEVVVVVVVGLGRLGICSVGGFCKPGAPIGGPPEGEGGESASASLAYPLMLSSSLSLMTITAGSSVARRMVVS